MSIVLGKNKKIVLVFIIMLTLILTGFRFVNNKSHVFINDQKIKVDIADESSEYIKGLSGREVLDKNRGMLFIFSDYSQHSFWMKDMLFPIDIIWIKDNKIVKIDKNIPIPNKKLEAYLSPEEVNYVLEVNAGYCDKYGIEVGDSVGFKL